MSWRSIAAPSARGDSDKRIRIHDAKTLAVLHEFGAHDAAITALAYHPTQPVLATGSADLTIRLWNLDNDSLIEELRPGPQEPQSLNFSPTGKRLASIAARGALRVWEFSE